MTLQGRITEILTGHHVSICCRDQAVADIVSAAEQHYRPRIETVEQLDALPDGVVVASAAGTFAARFDRVHGVVFGHDQPFRWLSLQLPVRVLWSPGAGE